MQKSIFFKFAHIRRSLKMIIKHRYEVLDGLQNDQHEKVIKTYVYWTESTNEYCKTLYNEKMLWLLDYTGVQLV